jgi:CelD/BcsL family acetyltransferase involved in cellulose biosynthesis
VDFEVVADEPGLRRLKPEWCDLFERARRRNHFQTFGWILRSWEHIARRRGQKLFVIVGRQAGRVVLIWPLARYRHLLWRAAEWIGAENAYLQDVLVEDAPDAGEWLEAAWSYVTNRIDFMWLNRLSDDALLVPFLRRVEGAKVDVEAAPYIDWSDWPDWETYMKRSRNLRGDLARRRRRLAEQGAVAFDVLTSVPEIEKTLDWVLEQKAAWMKRTGLRMREGGVDTAGTQEFFRAVVADAHASGNLCFATLTLDGKLLAAELGWVFQGTFAYEIGAYDPAWEKYAPAKLLIADLVRWTLENGFAIFDFMPIGQSYKYLWASREAGPTTYLVPCSPWGRVLVAWRRSRPGAAARTLLRLRPADVPRIVRNRLSRRSRAPKPKLPAQA